MAIKRRYAAVFTSTLLLVCVWQPLIMAAGSVTLSFDLNATGKTISNAAANVNCWFIDGWAACGNQPADFYSTHDPYIKRVELMTATGGNTNRDLFVDPNNRTNLTDYKFDKLMLACTNIVRQGLKPWIVTGNVPLKYSANPVIGTDYSVNVTPPDDYNVYYNYIKAIADALRDQFGIDEVKTWSWGVLTEYENSSWFTTGDPNSTKIAYFKLYDYTVAALEDSLGTNNVYVGAHSMTCVSGFWDEKEFINHCKNGTNYKRGTTGAHIDYLTISYYDDTPTGFNGQNFLNCINDLRNYANSIGLTGLQYGVDEGRVLSGWDGVALSSRDVAHCCQGSADAKMFKLCIVNDVEHFSQWDGGQATCSSPLGQASGSSFDGANTVSGNLRNLFYKMVGDSVLQMSKSGSPANGNDDVDGMAGYNPGSDTLHVLSYNNNGDPNATTTETMTLVLTNIPPVGAGTVTVKKWILDETHANWWSTWWQDQAGHVTGAYSWSKYSSGFPFILETQADKDYWNFRESTYKALGELSCTTSDVPIQGNSLTLTENVAHHGVVLYEIGIRSSMVATPTFAPTGGLFHAAQQVTISCLTTGAVHCYYTKDGSDPTTNSMPYSSPILVDTNMTLKAIATRSDLTNSPVATGVFTVQYIVPGTLIGSGATGTSATVNLTTEGTDDWAHWGLSGTSINHKSVSGSAVNHITETQVGSPQQYSDNINGYSWSDGTPTVSVVGATKGIYVVGAGNSFTITVPADTAPRMVKVYAGGWQSRGTLTSHLSDDSAADFTDSSFSNNAASYYVVYTITYQAGATNQNMTVRWQMASGSGGGNVTLQAATLQRVAIAEVIRFVQAGESVGSTPGCWFNWCGTAGATNTFNLYRSTNLMMANWQLVAPNIARSGTGTNTWMDTNEFQRAFYRVVVP